MAKITKRWRKLHIFCILFALFMICVLEYQASFIATFGQYKLVKKSFSKDKIVIIIFTSFFNHKLWGGGTATEKRIKGDISKCKENISNECIVTYNHTNFQDADALLFHGRNVEREGKYSPSNLIKLRHDTKAYHQKWIFLSQETPVKGEDFKYQSYDSVFNWTITYNRNSDVLLPYGGFKELNQIPTTTLKNYAKIKTKFIAWQISNCDPQLRLNYAKELEKYVQLDVYGRCGVLFKNNHGSCPRNEYGKCQQMLGGYKFYLAFENTFCTDYVTEKYWESLDRESVPIVMGDADDGSMIPGSFIDVNKFRSIKDLVDYLVFLDGNDGEYNRYFEWKNIYYRPYISFYCHLCQKLEQEKELQTKKKLQTTKLFSEKFSYGKVCNQKPERRRELERHIIESKKIYKIQENVLTSIKDQYNKFRLKLGVI